MKQVFNNEPIPDDFTKDQAKFILGIQANIRSKKIACFKQLQYQVFTWILAMVETGWTT